MTRSYDNWTPAELIARLEAYDRAHGNPPSPSGSTQHTGTFRPEKPGQKPFDFSAHPRRKIALKFAYAGADYGGLAFQPRGTPRPTVEGVLFDALVRVRLVDPAVGPEGCGWERCGRTDKGVSGAGNVVSLWVRSAVGDVPARRVEDKVLQTAPVDEGDGDGPTLDGDFAFEDDDFHTKPAAPLAPVALEKELRYVGMLNHVLPPSIRVLAWAPVAPSFSARFACKYRHYKYFFSPHGLDLGRMRDAAARLVGEHDFRNLCKVDPAKQITVFHRRVLQAEIAPVPDAAGGMHVLDLRGTAFLYNQVRHIMALLFLVGAGLERADVVDALLNVDGARAGVERVDRKPEYQIADALPLVLWECGYAPEDVAWQVDADTHPHGAPDLYAVLDEVRERSAVYNVLDDHLLKATAAYHAPPPPVLPLALGATLPRGTDLRVPLGGGKYRQMPHYVPLLKRNRLESVDVVNARWRASKGARREERRGTTQDVDEGGEE